MTKNWVVVEMFCVDVSSSMKRSNRWGPASLTGTSKWKQAKDFLRMNEKSISGSERYVGLVTFSEKAELILPIMNERNWRNESFLDVLDTIKPCGDTNLFDALELCYECLNDFAEGNVKTKVEGRIYVLTDGKDNITSKERKEEIIKKLGLSWDKGYTEITNLIVVGFGSDDSQENVRDLSKSLPNSSYINYNPANAEFSQQFLGELLDRSSEVLLNKVEDGYGANQFVASRSQSLVHPITCDQISICDLREHKKKLVENEIKKAEEIIKQLDFELTQRAEETHFDFLSNDSCPQQNCLLLL